jgi:hypothetical protein
MINVMHLALCWELLQLFILLKHNLMSIVLVKIIESNKFGNALFAHVMRCLIAPSVGKESDAGCVDK